MGYFTCSPLAASIPHTPMARDVRIRPPSPRNWPKGLAWWQRSKQRRDTSRELSKPTPVWAAALDRSITMPRSDAGRGMQRARSEGKSRLTLLVHERRFLTSLRVAHLATADTGAIPHGVPVCFVVCADTLYVTIDAKLKSQHGSELKRTGRL